MSALNQLTQLGVTVCLSETGRLKIQGRTDQMDQAQIERVMEYARKNKTAIIGALSQGGAPGECESCPAAGYWDYSHYVGRGLFCFHDAYFLGKPGRPNPCSETRKICPREENTGK